MPGSQTLTRSERIALLAFAAVSLVLRYFAFFRYRFDSDEPQHLHVAWGWTAGFVPYRDYFDNHAPLFHLATAPLLAALGERANILLYMRAAMLPLFAVVLACTYLIAARVYSRRIALWSVVLLSLFPPFFLKSLEYRNDNLWNALWIVALLLVISGPPTVRRWFLAGLVLGCALAVSLKSIVLVGTLAGAGIVTRYVTRDRTRFALPALAATCGFVIVPAVVAGYFIAAGAWSNLVYCVLTFNTLLENIRPEVWLKRSLWPFAIAAIVLLARRYRGADPHRLYCAVAIALCSVTIVAFWPLISPRDLLPMMPLGAMFVAAAFDRFDDRVVICSVSAAVLAASLFYYADRFQNRTEEFVTMMNQVLGLTRPGETIMDFKGETIYRRRPYYSIIESITHDLLEKGLLPDRIPESVIAAHCYVAQADGAMWPPRAKQFLRENFLDLGRLRAAGQWIQPDGTFSIAVPGRYVVLNEAGHAAGTLEDAPYSGPRALGAGAHRFDRSVAGERLAVVWAPAFERGFSPFHGKDTDFVRYTGRRSRSKRYQ